MTAPPINPTELRRPSLVSALDLHCPLGTKYYGSVVTADGCRRPSPGAVSGIFIAAQLPDGSAAALSAAGAGSEREVRRVFERTHSGQLHVDLVTGVQFIFPA